MAKYFVTFNIPATAIDAWVANVSEEERQKQTQEMMQAWQEWMTAHEAQVVDKGNALGKTKRADANGVSDVRNDMNYYIIVEADSHDAAAQMFVDHPHIKTIPSAYAEIMDMSRGQM